MDNVLIIDKYVTGHNMEYIHHLYVGAIKKTENHYIFAVPQTFQGYKEKLVWPEAKNIEFFFLPEKNNNEVQIKNFFSDIKLLNRLIKDNNINKLFFINWISPFVFLFLNHKVSISGITYNIYLYFWKSMSLGAKLKTVIKELSMVWNPRVKYNLILNDNVSAKYLNRLYHTDKYRYLPDPFFLPETISKDIREELTIPKGKKVFLLFGTLSERKGTLDVLKSLTLLKKEELDKYHFIFAGRLTADISPVFYDNYNEIKNNASITLIDHFCSYELINNLCYSCDVILATHKKTSLSSGVIGYAAHYRKPVIGSSKGLIGKLIRRYEIGYQISEITPANLCSAYSKTLISGVNASKYEVENNIDAFNTIALDF